MRNYLFRGKAINRTEDIPRRTDYKNGDWVFGLVSRNNEFVAEMTNERGVSGIDVKPETIGQFTGYEDIHGNKIFTGDIVEYCDKDDCYYEEECVRFVGEVVFESGAFGIASNKGIPLELEDWCANDNFVSFWELDWNERFDYNVEVIGNIHDNPELLER